MGGRIEPERAQDQRADQAEIEQDRRRGGGGEAAERVEHAAIERDQRDEQDVDEGDPGQLDRALVAHAAGLETRRHDEDHPGHGDDREQHERRQHRELDRLRLLGEGLGRGPALALEGAREQGHEAGVEGALREQPAQEIGQLEGDEEGIRKRAGAEQRRDQDVADEAQEARDEGERSDRGDRAVQSDRARRAARRSRLQRPTPAARARASSGAGGAPPGGSRLAISMRWIWRTFDGCVTFRPNTSLT